MICCHFVRGKSAESHGRRGGVRCGHVSVTVTLSVTCQLALVVGCQRASERLRSSPLSRLQEMAALEGLSSLRSVIETLQPIIGALTSHAENRATKRKRNDVQISMKSLLLVQIACSHPTQHASGQNLQPLNDRPQEGFCCFTILS